MMHGHESQELNGTSLEEKELASSLQVPCKLQVLIEVFRIEVLTFQAFLSRGLFPLL